MKQFLHRKATLSKVLLVIRHTASTAQGRAAQGSSRLARSSKNCPSSGAIGGVAHQPGRRAESESQLATGSLP